MTVRSADRAMVVTTALVALLTVPIFVLCLLSSRDKCLTLLRCSLPLLGIPYVLVFVTCSSCVPRMYRRNFHRRWYIFWAAPFLITIGLPESWAGEGLQCAFRVAVVLLCALDGTRQWRLWWKAREESAGASQEGDEPRTTGQASSNGTTGTGSPR